jgi:hypothetical protein
VYETHIFHEYSAYRKGRLNLLLAQSMHWETVDAIQDVADL